MYKGQSDPLFGQWMEKSEKIFRLGSFCPTSGHGNGVSQWGNGVLEYRGHRVICLSREEGEVGEGADVCCVTNPGAIYHGMSSRSAQRLRAGLGLAPR